MLAMTAVLLVVAGGATAVGSAVVARHRAASAADLAALAAASRAVLAPAEACRVAAAVASPVGGRIESCSVEGATVAVTVQVPVAFAVPGTGPARAFARAGPVEVVQ